MAVNFIPCSVDGCKGNAHGSSRGVRGWCRNHYNRVLRHGSPTGGCFRARNKGAVCAVEGCNNAAKRRGWCIEHYGRWQRHGAPSSGRTRPGEAEQWLEAHREFDGDNCLIWPFSTNGNGYGTFKSGRRRTYAHRAMCEMSHGPAPTSKHEAAHSCGCGHVGCVNPKHLRWALPVENMADRYEHGTILNGEENPSSKLTEDDVRAIRSLRGNMTQMAIADMFNVSASLVGLIHAVKVWRHVD